MEIIFKMAPQKEVKNTKAIQELLPFILQNKSLKHEQLGLQLNVWSSKRQIKFINMKRSRRI